MKSVAIAKHETRIALKKYEKIEKEAKEAEKKALIAEEQVQIAKSIVEKAEHNEFKVRRCSFKPRELNEFEKPVVMDLTSRVKRLTKKRKLMSKKLEKMLKKSKLGVVSGKQQKLVERLKSIIQKTDVKIAGLERAIGIIQRPDKVLLQKRNITKIEAELVENFEQSKVKIQNKIEVISKNLVTLQDAAKKQLPEGKKSSILRKVKVLERVKAKLDMKIKVINMTIKSVTLESSVGKESALSRSNQHLVLKNAENISKLTARVNLSKKKIDKLKKIIPSVPEKKKPSLVKRIAYLQNLTKTYSAEIEKLQHQNLSIKNGGKKQSKKRPLTITERKVIRKLRQKIFKITKNTNMIKQEIENIRAEKPTSPVLVTANLNNILRYEKFIE